MANYAPTLFPNIYPAIELGKSPAIKSRKAIVTIYLLPEPVENDTTFRQAQFSTGYIVTSGFGNSLYILTFVILNI